MSKVYEVADEQDDIVVRFDSKLVDREALARLLDFIELESIRKHSALSDQDARALADEIDRTVWSQAKHKYSG